MPPQFIPLVIVSITIILGYVSFQLQKTAMESAVAGVKRSFEEELSTTRNSLTQLSTLNLSQAKELVAAHAEIARLKNILLRSGSAMDSIGD